MMDAQKIAVLGHNEATGRQGIIDMIRVGRPE